MDRQTDIRQARPSDMDDVVRLCWDYRALLVRAAARRPAIVEAYYAEDAFDALMAALPQKHARPDGAIFVGSVDGSVMGCAMTHRIDASTCEIKRVFVDPAARGAGLATKLIEAAKVQAASDGYHRMVLDSMIWLEDALRLYDHLGFTPCAPYYDPDPAFEDLLIFREIAL